ncbi:hypothetical protein [Roseobacter sp. HKCCA0434]|uniref:hypothetical protein n=1 Tax=Roseobacter sp. HKCCA0434 TaxID=3079297 RepID=UPI002905D1E3|nr:hypothetical protein [Roseobacter sp. HKCCA0434]
MTAGIGHNRPPESANAWARHCWTRARAELVGERMPIEMVRTRMARARELGLSFPQYRSILLGGGRDVTAFLFTCEGLHLKLRRELEMPAPVREKLAGIVRTDLVALSPSGGVPEAFRAELSAVAGRDFRAAGAEPEVHASWSEQRRAVRDLIGAAKLPAQSVVMIGQGRDIGWAEAAQLVRFIPREDYFEAC